MSTVFAMRATVINCFNDIIECNVMKLEPSRVLVDITPDGLWFGLDDGDAESDTLYLDIDDRDRLRSAVRNQNEQT